MLLCVIFGKIKLYTLDMFEEEFVNKSSKKRKLYENFLNWIEEVNQLAIPKYIWIGGSFITSKEKPKDIDIVLFFNVEELEKKKYEIKLLVETLANYLGIDSFIAWCYDNKQSPKNLKVIKNKKNYWKKKFGRDKENNPKDIIKITKKELLKKLQNRTPIR